MSLDSIGSSKNTEIVKSLSSKVKALVESVKTKDEPKIVSDSVKTQIKPNSSLIPAKTINLSTAVVKKVESDKPVLLSNVTESNRKEFNDLYSKIGTSFTKRFSGEEAKIAVKILSNDRVRVAASDKEKVNLIRVLSYEIEHAKKSDPKLYKELLGAIDKVVGDFESKGKMNTLTEYLFLELSNTGVMVLDMDDWAAKKIAQNEKILTATSPHQKTDLIYSLKSGYTAKAEEEAINKILKNAVNNGQFKEVMGQWSNLLDSSSSTVDAMYKNLGGSRRTEFLEIVKEGMKKDNIGMDVMVHLYGADKVYDDLKNLGNADRKSVV